MAVSKLKQYDGNSVTKSSVHFVLYRYCPSLRTVISAYFSCIVIRLRVSHCDNTFFLIFVQKKETVGKIPAPWPSCFVWSTVKKCRLKEPPIAELVNDYVLCVIDIKDSIYVRAEGEFRNGVSSQMSREHNV